MSTDTFEHELRSLLQDTADAEGPAYIDVDPGIVVSNGRRVVRRRRITAVAGTAAAALVLGVGAWVALDQSNPRAVEPVPATRSASVAPEIVSATIPAAEGGPVKSYTLRLERATGRVTATYEFASGEQADAGMIGRIPVGGEPKAVWATVSRDPFIVVGVVPVADQLMTRFTGDVGGVTTSDAPLPATAYEACLVTTEKSPPEAALTDLVRATRGCVFAADGAELPSAALPDGRTVYVDATGGEMGVITQEGSMRGLLPPAATGAPTGHLTTAVKEAGKPTVTDFAIVLPIDAADVTVKVAPGASLVSTDERPLLGGSGLAVVATVDGPDDVSPAVTEVTWTAEGRTVAWQNPDQL